MDAAVARLNMEHHKYLLEREMDETKRRTIKRLLAEEDAKLPSIAKPSPEKRQA